MDLLAAVLWFFVLVFVLIIIAKVIYVLRQWENIVVVRFGQLIKIVKEPGVHLRIPFIDEIIRVDMRIQTMEERQQQAITKDNTSIAMDAVIFFKVEDVEKMVLNVVDYENAVRQYGQAAVRTIIGQHELDYVLEHRAELAEALKSELDKFTDEWGIDVVNAGLQDIILPVDMKRAFAVQAEAEREARAIITKSKAELIAAENLKQAADKMEESPIALQLRTLSTITDISKDQSNTVVLWIPEEAMKGTGALFAALATKGLKEN